MENGPDDIGSSIIAPPTINNGDLEEMANFPSTDDNPTDSPEVNGGRDSNQVTEDNVQNSSDCDTLVIDESVKPSKKKKKRTSQEFRHNNITNPYFKKSIFELSLYNNKGKEKSNQRKKKLNKLNGLQPSVQFKCSRCGSAGFQTLQTLEDHRTTCTAEAPVIPPPVLSNNSTNFRVTRKVFLCSACGTYYENFNLFLHMREVHKRFICLYCLGMFSQPETLCYHLVTKHNCAPARFETINDFNSAHNEPCLAVCCACHTVFSEQDNFASHTCIDSVEDENDDESKISDDKTRTQPNSEMLESTEVNIPTSDNSDSQDNVRIENLESSVNIDSLESNDKENIDTLKVNANQMSDETNFGTPDNCKESDCSESAENNNSDVHLVENETIDETKSVVKEENCDEPSNVEDSSENSQDRPSSEMSKDKRNLDENGSTNNEANDPPEYQSAEEGVEKQEEPNNVDMEIDFSITNSNEEVRKVPKVTLKLAKLPAFNPSAEYDDDEDDYQSEDSEKLTMEMEKESDGDAEGDGELCNPDNEDNFADYNEEETSTIMSIPTAGPEVAIIELELEQPLDKFDIKVLLQKCLGATIPTCLYCNHARKICVNGKQLGYHAIAEHRFSAVVNSITAEELIPESFNSRIKESFSELEDVYFNLECVTPEGGVTFSHMFECFQCRFSTTVHKELYLHNRKLHSKAILLCIMCKTSFYSYSELICHLCPGIYGMDESISVRFRCCLCVSDDLTSAFRLMVHLRKRHHVCDVCLEMCHNQSKLSNHVWKHKLHHLCYRCGIAYRNKPDITKHLFWKHGTESSLCKKCLHKRWPHVYHFCIPPPLFTCEECNSTFSRAVCLKVHKRLHAEEYPYTCTEEGCSEKCISKKLLVKHEFKHRQPIEEVKKEEEVEPEVKPELGIAENAVEETDSTTKPTTELEEEEKSIEKPKPKVDVFDLPELNLSESDSSDSENENNQIKSNETTKSENVNILVESQEGISKMEYESVEKVSTEENTVPVLENVWDDFKNYQANIVKLDILTDVGNEPELPILTEIPKQLTLEEALRHHDYCARTMDTLKEQDGLPNNQEMSADHDYCTAKAGISKEDVKPVIEEPKAKISSDSSSDSGSSSCTCGSDCSCSSSSGGSSSSSDSSESDSSSEEGRRKQQLRREKRRQKKTKSKPKIVNKPPNLKKIASAEAKVSNDVKPVKIVPQPTSNEVTIEESDLETTETDTDEDFYDKEPQKMASKLIAEKREKLLQMAGIGPYINGSMIDSRPSTPSLPEEVKPKKKSKSKKKKKKKSSRRAAEQLNHTISHDAIPPLTLTIPKNSPSVTPAHYSAASSIHLLNSSLTPTSQQILDDSNTRASKRRRVPNKFYGYSSDEEAEKAGSIPPFKYKKVEAPLQNTQLVVPPLTIKTPQYVPTVEPISIRMSATPGEMKVQPLRLPFSKKLPPKPKARRQKPIPALPVPEQDSGSESNTSSSEEDAVPKLKPNTPALYCYCRCPYDEVSEMIGCDSDECAIEWFHFECVGIMVPPKGQWYCPDCRKRKQQRRDMLQTPLSS